MDQPDFPASEGVDKVYLPGNVFLHHFMSPWPYTIRGVNIEPLLLVYKSSWPCAVTISVLDCCKLRLGSSMVGFSWTAVRVGPYILVSSAITFFSRDAFREFSADLGSIPLSGLLT